MVHARVMLLLLALAPLATAGETATVALGRMLRKARDAGALDRILEERNYLRTWNDSFDAVVTTRGKRLEDGSGISFEVVTDVRNLKPRLEREMVVVLFDGRLRKLVMEVREGGKTRKGEAELQEGKATDLEIRSDDGAAQKVKLKPNANSLPSSVLRFLLPTLHDQGLPAELPFGYLDGSPALGRLQHEGAEITIVDRPQQPPQDHYRIRVGEGKLIEASHRQHKLTAITPEEAKRRLAAKQE